MSLLDRLRGKANAKHWHLMKFHPLGAIDVRWGEIVPPGTPPVAALDQRVAELIAEGWTFEEHHVTSAFSGFEWYMATMHGKTEAGHPVRHYVAIWPCQGSSDKRCTSIFIDTYNKALVEWRDLPPPVGTERLIEQARLRAHGRR